MFLDEPIKFTNTGHVNHENERRIALRWLDYCGIKYYNYSFGKSGGFYFVESRKKNRKVYLCCSRDIGKRAFGYFWFGVPISYIRGNADTGLILIMVWEDRTREYLVFNNRDVLMFRNIWYNKYEYYSIDINVQGGKYFMRGKNSFKLDVRENLNNILLLFERA